jgi:hypothetical protein
MKVSFVDVKFKDFESTLKTFKKRGGLYKLCGSSFVIIKGEVELLELYRNGKIFKRITSKGV